MLSFQVAQETHVVVCTELLENNAIANQKWENAATELS